MARMAARRCALAARLRPFWRAAGTNTSRSVSCVPRGSASAENARGRNGMSPRDPRDPAPAECSGMDPFTVSHFSNDGLLHNLRLLVAHDCRTTAVLLTRIAEVE